MRRCLPVAGLAGSILVALLSCALPLLAAEPTDLVDRIVAVVNEEAILASDLDRLIGLGLVERQPGESDRDLRRRVLDELIEQRIRLQEVERFGLAQVPVRQIDEQVAEIRGRFPDEEAFERRLDELGLDREGVRHVVAQQLAVLTYVEERLGARVFVGLEEIRAYYTQRLVPELEAAGLPVPPLEEVREQIRRVLREELLNLEIERWTRELRAQADVIDTLDREPRPLPPVVHVYGGGDG